MPENWFIRLCLYVCVHFSPIVLCLGFTNLNVNLLANLTVAMSCVVFSMGSPLIGCSAFFFHVSDLG
uniref:Uncharacterized protein n=1 Tax=Arundo donax TaxID=35708 RepID=A0A0A8Z0M5_ARUDO